MGRHRPARPRGRPGRGARTPSGPPGRGPGHPAPAGRPCATRRRRAGRVREAGSRVDVAQGASQDHSSCQALSPLASVPVSLGSSPMTTSIAAPKRNPVTTARERNRAIQPSFATTISRKTTPRCQGDAGDEARDLLGVVDARGDHGARRDRSQTRARADRDLAAGAEDRRRGSPPPPRRRGRAPTGCPRSRVAEVLRHDQRGHRHAGERVTPEPAPVVVADPAEHGDRFSRQRRGRASSSMRGLLTPGPCRGRCNVSSGNATLLSSRNNLEGMPERASAGVMATPGVEPDANVGTHWPGRLVRRG